MSDDKPQASTLYFETENFMFSNWDFYIFVETVSKPRC